MQLLQATTEAKGTNLRISRDTPLNTESFCSFSGRIANLWSRNLHPAGQGTWLITCLDKMPNYIGLSFHIQPKRMISSSTNSQHCPLPAKRSCTCWTAALNFKAISVLLLPLLTQDPHFHYNKELNLVLSNGATVYPPALLLAAGITELATGPTASTLDPATSGVWGEAAQLEPCPALRLGGFSMGHLSPLCRDPPHAYWY